MQSSVYTSAECLVPKDRREDPRVDVEDFGRASASVRLTILPRWKG